MGTTGRHSEAYLKGEHMKIKLDERAIAPQRAHETDAGLDLFTPENFVIFPNERKVVNTGVHVQLPKDTVGYIKSKSGLMAKGILTDGTIDEGYTGAIGVVLFNFSETTRVFEKGTKIAQLVVQPVKYPGMVIVDKLEETDRGDGGFGSTGR